MKKQYKALMIDLDGTTVPNRLNGRPSKRVLHAINEASKRMHVGVVTGRTLWQAVPILDMLKLRSPNILLNGALIIDGVSREVLYKKALVRDDYETIFKKLKKADVRFTIDDLNQTVENTTETEVAYPISMFIWDQTEERVELFIKEFSHMPHIALNKVVGWKKGTVGLNISHKTATKQHGVFEVAKLLGIDTQDIIGIGDGPNDFPLLMACGLKIAMGNAVPDLKAIADYVAPSVDEDGLAHVIEKFILD